MKRFKNVNLTYANPPFYINFSNVSDLTPFVTYSTYYVESIDNDS